MSNEREELLEALNDLESVCYEYESLLPIATYLKKHLAKPAPITPRQSLEEYRRGYWKAVEDLELEPLSDEEITTNTPKLIPIGERLAFHAGIRWAEAHHKIGVDDE